MNLQCTNIVWLLVLANKPAAAYDVTSWQPFGHKKLVDIIENHNERCKEKYKQVGMYDPFLEEFAEKIKIVQNDLTTINKMKPDEFEGIKIIMVDLDVIAGKSDMLQYVRANLANVVITRKTIIFVAEVTHQDSASIFDSNFKGITLPAYPKQNKALVDSEENFESWLEGFCRSLISSSIGVERACSMTPKSTGLEGDVCNIIWKQGTFLNRYKIAAEARDAAMMENLSADQTTNLAHRLMVQEISLDWIQNKMDFPVILDHIRCQPKHIDITSAKIELGWGTKPLCGITLTRSPGELSKNQRVIAKSLGLTTDHSVFHYDGPEISGKLSALGNSVKIYKFEAILPDICKIHND